MPQRKRGLGCQFPCLSDSWAWAAGAGECAVELELSVVACERGVLCAGDAFFESAIRSSKGMMQHLKVQPGRVLPSSAVEPHGTSGSAEIGRSRRPTRKLPWVGVVSGSGVSQGVNVLSFFKSCGFGVSNVKDLGYICTNLALQRGASCSVAGWGRRLVSCGSTYVVL